MEDGRIPKDLLYGELASRRRSKGRPQLHLKVVCKRHMKALDINTDSCEDLAADRLMWRSTLNQRLKTGEKKLVNAEVGKSACRKERKNSDRPETIHKCDFAAEIVSPTSVSTATSDAATIEQTRQQGCIPMIKLDRQRPYICHCVVHSCVCHCRMSFCVVYSRVCHCSMSLCCIFLCTSL